MLRQRIFQFYGILSRTPESNVVSIETTLANNPPIANTFVTEASPKRVWPDDQPELFATQPVDLLITGYIPLSITVHSGALFFGTAACNYTMHWTDDGYANPKTTFYNPNRHSEFKKNVKINGVAVPAPPDDSVWFYKINTGETFTCDVFYNKEYETLVPVALNPTLNVTK